MLSFSLSLTMFLLCRCCWCFCCVLQSRRPSFCPINETEDREGAEDCGKTAVVFSLKNEVGCLVKALRLFQVRRHTCSCFTWSLSFMTTVTSPPPLLWTAPALLPPFLQEKRVNLKHIESRVSRRVTNEVEIFADCSCSPKEFNELLQHLKDHVNIISFNTSAHVWSAEAGTNTWALTWCRKTMMSSGWLLPSVLLTKWAGSCFPCSLLTDPHIKRWWWAASSCLTHQIIV